MIITIKKIVECGVKKGIIEINKASDDYLSVHVAKHS